jgi:hypothetical protein
MGRPSLASDEAAGASAVSMAPPTPSRIPLCRLGLRIRYVSNQRARRSRNDRQLVMLNYRLADDSSAPLDLFSSGVAVEGSWSPPPRGFGRIEVEEPGKLIGLSFARHLEPERVERLAVDPPDAAPQAQTVGTMLEHGAEAVDPVGRARVVPDAAFSQAGSNEPVERVARRLDRYQGAKISHQRRFFRIRTILLHIYYSRTTTEGTPRPRVSEPTETTAKPRDSLSS